MIGKAVPAQLVDVAKAPGTTAADRADAYASKNRVRASALSALLVIRCEPRTTKREIAFVAMASRSGKVSEAMGWWRASASFEPFTHRLCCLARDMRLPFVRGHRPQPLSHAGPLTAGLGGTGIGSMALAGGVAGGLFQAGAGADAAALWFQAGLGAPV